MLAVKKQEVRSYYRPKAARRRRAGLLCRLFRNSKVCILMLAAAACFVLIVYASAYARVAEEGYRKAELLSQLRALKLENQELRLQRDIRRQPDRITAFAEAHGMKPSQEMAYLRRPAEECQVATNTSSP